MAGLHSLLHVTADLVARIGPILLFLVFATVLAGLCAGLGLFDLVADAVVHAAHGSVRRVWAGLVAVAVASTALLSLDTTAVLCGAVVMPAWCGGVTCSTCGWCRGCWRWRWACSSSWSSPHRRPRRRPGGHPATLALSAVTGRG